MLVDASLLGHLFCLLLKSFCKGVKLAPHPVNWSRPPAGEDSYRTLICCHRVSQEKLDNESTDGGKN